MRFSAVFVLSCLLLSFGCAGRKDVNRRGEIKLRGEKPVKMKRKDPGDLLQKGIASWYGHPYHGRKTSNGETYDMNTMTAAHKTIPFDTVVKVVDVDSGKHVFVRINDRGPFIRGRVIDLSRAAARKLGIFEKGTTQVRLYLAEARDLRKQGGKGKSKSKPKTARRNETKTPPAKPKPRSKPKPVEPAEPVIYAPDEVIEEEVLEPENPRDVPTRKPLPKIDAEYWTIQVGSFSTRDRAEVMAQDMRRFSSSVFIMEAGGSFRVRVGKFLMKGDARDLATALSDENIPTWVTRLK